MTALVPAPNTPVPSSVLNTALIASASLSFVGRIGVAGYMFKVKTEISSDDKAVVTEHWVQSGYFVNDNIVFPPKEITIRGIVSETEIARNSFVSSVTNISKVVGIIGAYAWKKGNQVISVIESAAKGNQINNANSLLSSSYTNGFDIYSAVQNLIKLASNQGQVYTFFTGLRDSRTIISILTPLHFYPSVVITQVRSTSPQESNAWCNMELKFQEWRSYNVSTTTIPYVPTNTAPGLQNSMSPVVNNGLSTGVSNPTTSFGVNLFSGKAV